MTEDPEVLGFSSVWYPKVVATAERRVLVTERAVLVPTPALLLACKLEAWENRGTADPYASRDLEDVAALLDGCRELELSVRETDSKVRSWIRAALTRVVGERAYEQALIGQLPRAGDAAGQELRVRSLVERICQHGSPR